MAALEHRWVPRSPPNSCWGWWGIVPWGDLLVSPPAPQGPFCCHHLFLHGRGWHRGVDPLPEGAPGAEGVLFPKQAGTRAEGSGWAQGRSEIPPARMHPLGCSSQSCITTVLGLSFLLGDEKNLFSLSLVSWGPSVQLQLTLAGARLGSAMALDHVPHPGENRSLCPAQLCTGCWVCSHSDFCLSGIIPDSCLLGSRKVSC